MVTKGPFRGLRFARRQITPNAGCSRMRCGKCGFFDFEAHVRPDPTALIGSQTMAQIAVLVCLGCTKVYKFDQKGTLQATGKVEPTNLVDPDYIAPDPTDVRAEEVRKANGS